MHRAMKGFVLKIDEGDARRVKKLHASAHNKFQAPRSARGALEVSQRRRWNRGEPSECGARDPRAGVRAVGGRGRSCVALCACKPQLNLGRVRACTLTCLNLALRDASARKCDHSRGARERCADRGERQQQCKQGGMENRRSHEPIVAPNSALRKFDSVLLRRVALNGVVAQRSRAPDS